jgi:hypothetical protein
MAASDAFLSALLGKASSPANVGTLTDDPALDSFARNAAENSIFYELGAPISHAKFDTSTWSPTQSAAVSLGQSFLSGLLGRLGSNDVASQLASTSAILPSLYRDPLSVSRPEGVDAQSFETLKASAIRENAKRDRQLQDSVIGHVFTSNPNFAAVAPETAAKVGLTELGSKLAEMPRRDPLKDPDSAEYKLQSQTIKEEDDRRKEILSTPMASSVSQALTAIPTLREMAKDDTKTSDIPFVYKLIQAQDGGVVKEGEQQMVAGTAPVLTKYKAMLEGALNGRSELTPAIKQQMLDEMARSTSSQWKALKARAEPILSVGEARGAKRDRMLPFDDKYVTSVIGDFDTNKDSQGIDLAAVKNRAAAIVQRAKQGSTLTPEDRQFMESIRKFVTVKN